MLCKYTSINYLKQAIKENKNIQWEGEVSDIRKIWKKSHIEHISNHEIKILIKEKFITERGRINCSLQEHSGKWRWLGIQYVIAEY